jgi:tetratricopeptide (TPR) repeat protein
MRHVRTLLLVASLAAAFGWGTPSLAHPPEEKVAEARVLFQEGQAAYAAGRFDVAAEKMVQAFGIIKRPELAYNIARTYERMGEYDKAIHYFRIYLKRGTLDDAERRKLEQRIEAIEAAKARRDEQIFALPASEDEMTAEARTFFLRGVAMFRARHYEAAMQAFMAAHRFAPLPAVLYNLAITAERMGAKRDALDYYREYLLRWPEAPDRADVEKKIAALRSS